MKEEFLIKISLVTAIIGIVIIFISNKIYEPEIKKIADITGKENMVKIKGEIRGKIISKQDNYFLKIQDETGIIDVVIFNNTNKKTTGLESNATVNVVGKPNFYKGKLQIIASQLDT